MSETIGIVGMGVMVKNIALNFSDNDINVVVFNKSKNKIQIYTPSIGDFFINCHRNNMDINPNF